MPPFIDDEDDNVISEYPLDSNEQKNLNYFKSFNFRNEKTIFIIGGITSIVAFLAVIYIMLSGNEKVNLEDLPIIKADQSPIKIKPNFDHQIAHQDKVVYDNIDDVKRAKPLEKILDAPEEILSINENDEEELSENEKQSLIKAFDDLAPEKQYNIKYVKKTQPNKDNAIKIVEQDSKPQIKKNKSTDIKKKKSISEKFIANNLTMFDDEKPMFFIQIASVRTKISAEAEYQRIRRKNKVLNLFDKKINKVDLGANKGIRYRVRIGPFKNQKEAKKILSKLAQNGCNGYIVK